MIYQPEDYLIDEYKAKKITLHELEHVFKMYLQENNLHYDDISTVGHFLLIFNDPVFKWHTLSKQEQSDALSDAEVIPQVYDELVTSLSTIISDETNIKRVIKDAYQNALTASLMLHFYKKIFNHVSRYQDHCVCWPDKRANGYGEIYLKPKKSFTGQEYGDYLVPRFVDWLVKRYIEKENSEVKHNVA